jgi:hypothetical protein
MIRSFLLMTFAFIIAAPASAQTPAARSSVQRLERGYITIAGGIQATDTFTDRFDHAVNAETATTDARYPARAGVLLNVGVGRRLWPSIGAAVHLTRAGIGRRAHVDSAVPHPFFDNRHRQVAGVASDLTRSETAVHLQLNYQRAMGRWTLRAGAGPSYVHVEQEVVTGVTVDEEFPYDTATFRDATSTRAKRGAVGFNAGGEISRTFTRRLGAAFLGRFTRARVALNVERGHRVSIDAGGAQVGAGLRVAF